MTPPGAVPPDGGDPGRGLLTRRRGLRGTTIDRPAVIMESGDNARFGETLALRERRGDEGHGKKKGREA